MPIASHGVMPFSRAYAMGVTLINVYMTIHRQDEHWCWLHFGEYMWQCFNVCIKIINNHIRYLYL